MQWQRLQAWHQNLSQQSGPRRLGWRIVVLLVSVGLIAALYSVVGALTVDRSYDLTTAFDAAIPFLPWTWWIYVPGYFFGLIVAVLAIKDDTILYRSLGAILVAQLINCVFYFAIPSSFPRPVAWQGTGLTADLIHWYWRIDKPNNTFPSTHVAIAVIGALGLWRERNRFRWIPTLTAIGVFVTVHTAKQHYWVDSVAGAVVGAVSHHLVFSWGARWWGSHQPPR